MNSGRVASLSILLGICCITSSVTAHDSPIDHVERTVQIYIEAAKVHVIYRFRCEERQAMLQLHEMDADRDGKISDGARAAYFKHVSDELSKQLHVEVEGKDLP